MKMDDEKFTRQKGSATTQGTVTAVSGKSFKYADDATLVTAAETAEAAYLTMRQQKKIATKLTHGWKNGE